MERHDDNALIIYSDGSCLAKPRRGGYAYRFVVIDSEGREVFQDFSFPGFLGATNNEMELTACVAALQHATSRHAPIPRDWYEKIVIYSDSTYVVDGIYQADAVWPTNGWVTRDREPVLSRDLWNDLVREKQRAGRVEFRHVEGHKSNPHNQAVDRLAKAAAQLVRERGPIPRRATSVPPIVRRRTSPRKTQPRSVEMSGQIETIRIVAARAIRGQTHHTYKYEVVTQGSRHAEAVDDAFARNDQMAMRPGHCYEVRVAGRGEGRWIRDVIREVEREPPTPQRT